MKPICGDTLIFLMPYIADQAGNYIDTSSWEIVFSTTGAASFMFSSHDESSRITKIDPETGATEIRLSPQDTVRHGRYKVRISIQNGIDKYTVNEFYFRLYP